MFIFVLQTIWLYITELAGKDLDLIVVGKFLLYFAPKMVPLVLPLTILLASIMVFGNFAENYEFAAMKSTGISLQRAMRSLSVFIFGLAIIAFFFANNVIPWAEFKSYNLRRNIAKVKPAMAIAEGQFNEVGNINIKVDKKSGDRGQYLKGVVIHEKSNTLRGNYKVIISETGELISSEDSNILQLELRNGNYYEEIVNRDARKNISKPHARSYFDKYIINVDLEILNNQDLDEDTYTGRYNMLDIAGLNYTIDSLYVDKNNDYEAFSKTLYNRTTYQALNNNINTNTSKVFDGDLLELYNTRVKVQLLNLALNTANSTKQIVETNNKTFETRSDWLNRHIIALHEKYVLGLACIILFFVGAPLGALIRKGGIGLPMVVAILLFLTYHFIGIFAKNSSRDGTINPVFATWLSTLIMLPLGVYLTSRATRDRGLFDLDQILDPIKRVFNFKSTTQLSESETKSYNYFKKYSIEELVAVVKKQQDFDLDKKPKEIAIRQLLNRKLSLNELNSAGLQIPEFLIQSKKILKDYIDYAKASLISYIIALVLLVLHFVFNNNKLPELAITVLDLSIASWVFFGIFAIASTFTYTKYYATIKRQNKRQNPLVLLITIPLYPIAFLFLKSKSNQDFEQSCIKNIN